MHQEFDIGLLGWVKSEIGVALSNAVQSFDRFLQDPREGGALQPASANLHQVSGALQMIGLDPVARVSEQIEAIAGGLAKREIKGSSATVELCKNAITMLGDYLETLQAGEPSVPLKLFPVYRELCRARGMEQVTETDLFYPDLSALPPLLMPGPPLSKAEHTELIQDCRLQFEAALLNWLRHPSPAAVKPMIEAVGKIEAAQAKSTSRAFWWIAGGFLDALANGDNSPAAKLACSRINMQMKRLADGSDQVAERLMRDVLYVIARAKPVSAKVKELQHVYRLKELLPPEGTSSSYAPPKIELSALLRDMRELLASLKESWIKFTSGNKASLPTFVEQSARLREWADKQANPSLTSLARGLGSSASTIQTRSQPVNDALALEMATTLLLIEKAVDSHAKLGIEFDTQAQRMMARLDAAVEGKAAPAVVSGDVLDDISRKAQEKLVLSQVGQEIQSNLHHIEQVLDAYFRNPAKRPALASLTPFINQVQGALAMLELDHGVEVIKAMRLRIETMAKIDAAATHDDTEAVAEGMSGLSLYITALQQGQADREQILQPVLARLRSGMQAQAPVMEALPTRVEDSVEKQKLHIDALYAEWQRGPKDDATKQQLRYAVAALQQDAALVSDPELKQHTEAVLKQLDAPAADVAALAQALAAISGKVVQVQAPSAQVSRMVNAPKAEIDAELLGIFLEEAEEVLDNIGQQLQVVRAANHHVDALTTIRRAYHTLKGSGRMVGLTDLGEAAWQVEQVMNKWLQDEKPASPGLIRLIGDSHQTFGAWVQSLNQPGSAEVDYAPIIAMAEQLMAGREPAEAPKGAQAEKMVQIGDLYLAPSFFAIYQREADQHLHTLRSELAKLRVTPSGGISHEFMRAAHTLSGISRTTGFATIAELGAALEDNLQDGLEHPTIYTASQLQVFDLAVDRLSAMVGDVNIQRIPEAAPQLIARLNAQLEAVRSERNTHESAVQRWQTAVRTPLSTPIPDVPDLPLHITSVRQGVAPNQVTEGSKPSITTAPASITAAAAAATTATSLIKTQPIDFNEKNDIDELTAPIPNISLAKPVAAPSSTVTQAVRPKVYLHANRRKIDDDIDEELLPIFLEEAHELLPQVNESCRAWRMNFQDKSAAAALRRHLHTLKGGARMTGAMRLGELAHILESQAVAMEELAASDAAKFDELQSGIDRMSASIERMQKGEIFEEIEAPLAAEEGDEAGAMAVPILGVIAADAAAGQAMLRVRAEVVDRLVNNAGELAISRTRIEGELASFKQSLSELTENVSRLRTQLRELEIQAESQIQSSVTLQGGSKFDPLELDRFTRMQELTRIMAESVNDVATVQQTLLKNIDESDAALLHQSRLNRDMQQELMDVRTVPLNNLADRFYRLVRQTAKEVAKKANLEMRGARVELDRSVLEKIIAPFEHLLRNAVMHGLETPENRLKANKPEIGEIVLDAKSQGNDILLTLSDDGSGLDFARIHERAVEMKLLAPDQRASDAELTQLIFLPGFSTATAVTQLAGRGVGMDVVKNEIMSLGGRIEVASANGRGTTFTITLPLTLAVTQSLMIRASGRLFAIPAVMVEQVQEIRQDKLAAFFEKTHVDWQGNSYPLHMLSTLLGEAPKPSPDAVKYPLLLLKSGVQQAAILADEIIGNREVVVKSIGPQLARLPGVSGATVMGNGQVVLIINPVELARRQAALAAQPVAPLPEVVIPKHEPRVMVVDDSLTVRKITSRLLTRENYEVLTAKDGVDALQQLQDIIPDIMLLDIEMPRMDGFELARNIRADKKLMHIPIIMITSRTAEKHRNFALQIGVNEYLGKPYQEDELLGLIARYVKRGAMQ
jgi:chemosensory pili system protein ChpA (sensor histidine kinase/response regulator)